MSMADDFNNEVNQLLGGLLIKKIANHLGYSKETSGELSSLSGQAKAISEKYPHKLVAFICGAENGGMTEYHIKRIFKDGSEFGFTKMLRHEIESAIREGTRIEMKNTYYS